MRSVGIRELKLHLAEIIARVMGGERIVVSLRGRPVATLTPIDQAPIDFVIVNEADPVKAGSTTLRRASETAFEFWDNEEDAVWDELGGK